MRVSLRAITKKTALFATAFVLAVSTLTASVPFIFNESVGAASIHTVDLSGWDFSKTRASGHYQLQANGLRVWTDVAAYEGKVAGYRNASFPLSSLGSPSISYAASTGSKPGLNFALDIDNDGGFDGYLVVEETFAPNFWLSESSVDAQAAAPLDNSQPSYRKYWGNLSQWTAAFPNAQVTQVGFSLGSGALGDSTISKITAGGDEYTFGVSAPTGLVIKRDATNETITGGTVKDTNHTLTWTKNLQPNTRYQVLITAPDGVTTWTRSLNNNEVTPAQFDLNDPIRQGFFGIQQGIFTYKVRLASASTPIIAYTDWSAPVSLKFDSIAPSTSVVANDIALPENTPLSPAVLIPGANPTTFQATLSDEGSAPYGAYIELFKANWDGTYGNWVKDNTNGAGNVRYGASPKLVFNTSTLSGKYGLKIVSTDTTGNASTSYHFFTVDKDIPSITIKTDNTSIVEGSSATNPFTYISFKLHDVNGNLKEVELNGNLYSRTGTWADLNWSNINPAHIMQGINTVTVRDTAGNESTIQFSFDTIAPEVTLNPVPAFVRGTINVTGSISDNVGFGHYNLSLYNGTVDLSDGEAHASARIAVSGGWTTSGQTNVSGTSAEVSRNLDTTLLTDGTYQLRLAARDAAGNRSATDSVQYYSFTVDNSAPVVTLTSPDNGSFVNGLVTFEATVSDANAFSSEYSITGPGLTSPVTSTSSAGTHNLSWNTAGLLDGLYTIVFNAVDQAGNTTTRTVQLYVDNTGPEISVNAVAPITAGQNAIVTGTVDDLAVTEVEIFIDGISVDTALVDTGVFNFEITGLAAGTYELTLGAVDAIGNEGVSLARTIVVNSAPAPTGGTTSDGEPTGDQDGAGDDNAAGALTGPGPAIIDNLAVAVLGDTTDNTPTQGTQGATTDIAAQAVDADGNTTAWGLAWYWWLLIIAGISMIGWWVAAAIRRRSAEQN